MKITILLCALLMFLQVADIGTTLVCKASNKGQEIGLVKDRPMTEIICVKLCATMFFGILLVLCLGRVEGRAKIPYYAILWFLVFFYICVVVNNLGVLFSFV